MVFLGLGVVVGDVFGPEEFGKGDPVFFVQIFLYEIFYFFFEVFWFVLHVESPPVDAFYVLKPLVSDELVPHGQADSCS